MYFEAQIAEHKQSKQCAHGLYRPRLFIRPIHRLVIPGDHVPQKKKQGFMVDASGVQVACTVRNRAHSEYTLEDERPWQAKFARRVREPFC